MQKIKFTLDDLNNRVLRALNANVQGAVKQPSKPNLIELQRMAKQMRGKEGAWPLV